MTQVRARWILGSSLWFGALALSCGSGDTENLFTQPSTHGGESNAGASSQAGATHVGSGGAGGSGRAGGSSTGGSGHAGANGQAGAATGGAASGGAPTGGAPSGGAPGAGAPNGGAPGAGAPGAGAPNGGASGMGGSTAGSGGMSGGGGSAGAGTCVDNSACANDEYCAKTSCMAKAEGHCTKSPTDCGNTKAAVVCGCDGVTYHDACLLHQARQNANAFDSGACVKAAEGTVTCSVVDSSACTSHGGVCGFKAENACIEAGNAKGLCWVLPASCPGSDPNSAQGCPSGPGSDCLSECAAIKAGMFYVMPNSCN